MRTVFFATLGRRGYVAAISPEALPLTAVGSVAEPAASALASGNGWVRRGQSMIEALVE